MKDNLKIKMKIMDKGMRNALLGLAVAMMASAGCAKSEKTEPNESNKRFFDAWIQINHPDLTPTDLGVYIVDEKEGDGELYDGESYVYVKYVISNLDGTISSTNVKKIAQQVGAYNKSYYYGPEVWVNSEGMLQAGVADVLDGMRVGGSRTAVIPAWLMTTERYKKPSEYLKHDPESSNAIYTIELTGFTNDIIKSEADSLEAFSDKYLDSADSLSYGFYYKQLAEPTDTVSFPSDTTIYINYTGRLLNGQVFDTTIADTAKFYNVYSSSGTYEPVAITWSDTYTGITMSTDGSSSSSLISGFQRTLWQMRKYEKGVGMFMSLYGYGYSGSGKRIPSFAPLLFEIEIVDEP